METNVFLVGVAKVMSKRPAKDGYPARVDLAWIGGQVDAVIPPEMLEKVPSEGFVKFQAEFSMHPKFGAKVGKLTGCEPVVDPGASRSR